MGSFIYIDETRYWDWAIEINEAVVSKINQWISQIFLHLKSSCFEIPTRIHEVAECFSVKCAYTHHGIGQEGKSTAIWIKEAALSRS